MHVFAFESLVAEVAFFVLLAVKVFALVDALTRPAEAFLAAGKLTKPGWLLILGLLLVASVLLSSAFGLLSLISIVATFVYLLDVRPALASITRP